MRLTPVEVIEYRCFHYSGMKKAVPAIFWNRFAFRPGSAGSGSDQVSLQYFQEENPKNGYYFVLRQKTAPV
jgi:hypothetical protein